MELFDPQFMFWPPAVKLQVSLFGVSGSHRKKVVVQKQEAAWPASERSRRAALFIIQKDSWEITLDFIPVETINIHEDLFEVNVL